MTSFIILARYLGFTLFLIDIQYNPQQQISSNLVENTFSNYLFDRLLLSIGIGFANVNDACCGGGTLNGKLQCGLQGYRKCPNPNWYFFWDYFNPSEHTYRLLAKHLWDGNEDQIRPINLKALACNITLS